MLHYFIVSDLFSDIVSIFLILKMFIFVCYFFPSVLVILVHQIKLIKTSIAE